MAQALRLGPQGRIVIPVQWRRALHLEAGDTLVAWMEGEDRLVLRPRRAIEEELWALFKNVDQSLSADLLRERRAEAQAESAI